MSVVATMSFQQFLQQALNPAQAQAVTTTRGVLLIIAGAGSGKTRVITARIANLILNEQVPAHAILALTFTNKAAQEMRERVTGFLTQPTFALSTVEGAGADLNPVLPFVGTFHAYCLQLLKRNAHLLATPNFTILDSEDQEKLISKIIKAHNLQKIFTTSTALYNISQLKNNPAKFQDSHNQSRYRLLHDLLALYETEKKLSHCFDFDDLLLETLKLFAQPEFQTQFQRRVRHILIDEYQDTSVVQHQLLQKMALTSAGTVASDSLCIVGDEDQSIYSWRGATVDNIVNFRHEFAQTQVIKIEQNYRSVTPILAVANQVIKHNYNRHPKNLWSNRTAQHRVFKATCLSSQREAELVAQLVREKASQPQPLAVLYRTHAQSRAIEEALIKHNLPYQMLGGIRFYERKEIKDLLAYLKLVANPFDRLSLERVINCPPRKLGEKFWEVVLAHWQAQPKLDFQALLQDLLNSGTLTNQRQVAITEFLQLFSHLTSSARPSTAIAGFVNQVGYYSYLKDSYEPREADDKINNVKELIRAAEFFEGAPVNHTHDRPSSFAKATADKSITTFLEEIALLQEKLHANDQAASAPVILMTLHAAKGLEFDTVIIAGLEEGLLPSTRALSDPDAIEEERRLFYVGITRAREHLYLTHCLYRYQYGQTNETVISRFLKEIPAELYQEYKPDSLVTTTALTDQPIYGAGKLAAASSRNFSSAKNYNYRRQVGSPTASKHSITRAPHYQSATKATLATTANSTSTTGLTLFKLYTPVQHSKFGIGLVQKCEQRGPEQYFVTVKFKSGVTKELDAKFLTKL